MNLQAAPRDAVLKASRDYYAHRAYYGDLLAQGASSRAATGRELDFLESVFRANADHQVNDVLDVACGNGRHIIGLTGRGYRCTGLDYTSERIQVAKTRALHENASVKLSQGDATKLVYENEFDAVLALYILFLLPDDDDVMKCLQQIHRSLRLGGVMICNVFNPLSEQTRMHMQGYHVKETRARGIRCIDIERVEKFDRVRGVTWWEETSVIEAPDGLHIFRDHERIRLFTYWDILHYLQIAGFKEIKCYPDWKIKSSTKPKADWLVFVARKNYLPRSAK
jgi:SAM-dependent methyltransferase